ncbi:MAG: hypothetical protein PHV37_08570 [Candidatus Gastranaerophilales bacterium]|nr:hypothetical protein [Candidatus Gastranaerophilales bacterium]
MKNIIGFWGYPHPNVIKRYKDAYPQADWVDLDIDFSYPDTKILPESYCKIIKNIINNALYLKNSIITILAPIGKDKCDSGWFAAQLLKDMGFDVVETIFEDLSPKNEIKISTSNLPLRKKIEIITANIVDKKDISTSYITPTFGFWGVPPNDLSILELFPDSTHLYGWTRCVEAGTPADIELEMFVQSEVPTVFYAQAFCAKAQLAKYLADKYNGLFVDIDDCATNSTKAKIEAFLRLR